MAWAAATVRRHWAILILLGLAAALRVLVMVAYPPAFWFYGDSGAFIENSFGFGLNPYDAGGLGYSMALKVFKITGSFAVVAAVQHVTGLVLAMAVYAFLIRRVPRWLATVAAAPLLLDSMPVTLEHYVLGETLFMALAVGAVLLLLWPSSVAASGLASFPRPPRSGAWPIRLLSRAAGQGRPGVIACALAGFALMLAWFTRPSTIPMTVIVLGYLLIRRVGWRSVLAFAVAFLVPYAAVQAWIGDRPSAFGSSYANRALYARVASFVDCDRLQLTDAERKLCPAEPLGQRHDRADYYGWNGPALQVPKNDNEILRTFAMKAISAQPADYARVVLVELAPHFIPGRHVGPESDCLRERWSLPGTIRGEHIPTACTPALAQDTWQIKYADSANAPAATGLSRFLEGYSKVVRTIPVVTSLALLLALLALIRYRRGSADARDAVMLALIVGSLVVPPVLVAMYEARYGLPALPFACMAAALALSHLLTAPKRAPDAAPADELVSAAP